MRVTVHYMTQARRAAGCAREDVETPDAVSLRDFLHVLGVRHGPPLRVLLLDEAGDPRRSLLFFVGEEHAELSRSLREGDAVTILAPMAGG